jgi:LmbE family N-acetylglucosaminyl deacetylase
VILPGRVLFVGAHCDDVELLAGGLLFACCASKKKVGVLVFSDHRGVVDAAAAAQARAELRANLDWLREATGNAPVDHSGAMLPACQGAFESRRGEIYAALERLRDDYDLVVTHASGDTNQDHAQVSVEAVRVFKAHASVWGGEFPNNDVSGFAPSIFVALDEAAVGAKVRMVERYASQRFGGRPYLDGAVVRSLARVRGSQIREEAAEAFAIGARVVVRGERARTDGRRDS